MVVKRGNRELRSFCVVDVQNSDGCVTKFRAGRYTKSAPVGAARTAFTRLCNLKNIRGKCSLFITVKDTTQGHKCKGKEYTYKLERTKLKKPIIRLAGTDNEFKIEYVSSAKKATPPRSCKEGRSRSVGRMKKTSRRANKRRVMEKKQRMSMRKKKTVSGKKTKNMNNNMNNRNNMNGGRKSGRKMSKRSRKN
jgi:hypothetical protein